MLVDRNGVGHDTGTGLHRGVPLLTSIVRIVIAVSMLPEKSR